MQINGKSLGVSDKLIPVSARPHGQINPYRVAEMMKWTPPNTFTF